MWDREKVRTWLAGELGRSVPDELWEWLHEFMYIEQACYDQEGRDELLFRAKQLLLLTRVLQGQSAPPGRAIQISDLPNLPSAVEAWVDALSEYQAAVASDQPEVQEFRDNVLNGILSPEKALEFVRTPHLARCSRDGEEMAEEHREDLLFPSDKGKIRRRTVRRGSVLDELRFIGHLLAWTCLWRKADAVWYVLTDIVPGFRPIRVSARNYLLQGYPGAQVRLRVDVRTPASAVMRAYRKVQHEILQRDNRQVAERNSQVFRFVVRRTRETGIRGSWRRLMRDWNKANPKWRYEDPRNFHRDFGRAEEWLLRRFQLDALVAKLSSTKKKTRNNTPARRSRRRGR